MPIHKQQLPHQIPVVIQVAAGIAEVIVSNSDYNTEYELVV